MGQAERPNQSVKHFYPMGALTLDPSYMNKFMNDICIKRILPLIIFISALLYINTLSNNFVYDDAYIVTENHFIKTFKNLPKLFQKDYLPLSGELSYRPTVTLTYFIDYAVWELNPFGYHLTNIILHTINVLLFYILIKNISKSPTLSLLATLLFLSHPLLTETVNAVCYREDILTTLFSLLAFIYFRKIHLSQEINIRFILYYILSCTFYFLALFSKEMAITLPVLLILFDLFYPSKPASNNFHSEMKIPIHYSNVLQLKKWVLPYVGYALVTGFYLIVRFILLKNTFKTIEVYPSDVFTMTKVVASYLKLLFIPVQLNADYYVPYTGGTSLSFILSSLFIITAFIIVVRLHSKYKYVTFFSLWFFITLLPVLGIIPIGNIMAERYLYFPIIGFCAAAGCILSNNAHKRKGIIIVVTGIILFSIQIGVIQRNGVWRNDTTLWFSTLKREPQSARACSNAGNTYFKEKRYEDAINIYKRALTFQYTYPFIHFNLGVAYEKIGLIDEAIKEYKASISNNNDNTLAYNNLGTIYDKLGSYDLAIEAYKQALKISPYSPFTHNNLGNTYGNTGDSEKAMAEYLEALKIDDTYADAHNNVGAMYLKKGVFDKAIEELERATQLKPEHLDAHYNLGIAYATNGLYEEAICELLLAIKYNSNDYSAYRDIGILYFKHKKDVNRSLYYLNEALRLAPNPAETKKVKDMMDMIKARYDF